MVLNVKNISDLILKEIYDIYETKNLTKKQIRKYKMTERAIFEKYADLSEDELSEKKVTKTFMSKMMSWLLLLNVAEVKKKGGERKIYGFRKKLMIPESKISECPEHEVKSRKGNICDRKNTWRIFC